MVDKQAKVTLVEGIDKPLKGLLESIKASNPMEIDKDALMAAVIAIQKAVIRTRNFITDNGYVRNEDLTDLWHDALDKVNAARIDGDLPGYLYQKARFWGEPKNWLFDSDSLILVPKLNLLDSRCEGIMKQLGY